MIKSNTDFAQEGSNSKQGPQDDTTHSYISTKTQVDLFELFNIILQSKIHIIAISLIFTVAASIYAFTAQEWWSAKAKIIAPQHQDFFELNNEVRKFKPIFDIYQDDGTILISNEFNDLLRPDYLFTNFIYEYNSRTNKKEFLLNNDNFKSYLMANNIKDEDQINNVIEGWINKISAVIEKEGKGVVILRLQSITAKDSFDMLNAYVNYVSSKVNDNIVNDFKSIVYAKKVELTQKVALFEVQALNDLGVERQRTKLALDIASSAKILKPIRSDNKNDIFAIGLGSETLSARIKALDDVTNLGVIKPIIQTVNAKLSFLLKNEIKKEIEFNSFRYLESTEKPLNRDKPRKGVIILLGAFLGCVVGSFLVLILYRIKKKKLMKFSNNH